MATFGNSVGAKAVWFVGGSVSIDEVMTETKKFRKLMVSDEGVPVFMAIGIGAIGE